MKKINTQNKTTNSYSFEEVVRRASKTKTFRNAYDKELSRLRLAHQIRDARVAKNLTQKAVADRTGMPQSVIARVESGSYGVSLDTLERIAQVFGKKVQLV